MFVMVVIIRSVDLFSSSSVRVVQSVHTEIDRLIFPEVISPLRVLENLSDLEKLVSMFWGGIWAESNLLRQFALLDLSILNFSIVLGKSGGPSCNRPAKHHSRSHDAVIRVYDESGNLIEAHEHAGNFKEW